MRFAILAAALLLAACGSKTTTVTKDGAGGVTIQTENAVVSAGTSACTQKPDFVPVYAGAVVVTCVAGDSRGKNAGNMIYTVAATPAAVLDWSAAQGAKAGLTLKLRTDTMLSTGEADKRTLVVIASPEGAGTRAMVNWAVEP